MSIRDQFPIFQEKTYINSCSQGALSIPVKQAVFQYLHDWQEKGSPWELWVEKLEASRNLFAGMFGVTADEVAVNTSVSALVSAIVSGIDFSGERNKIVVTDFAFPTTAQVWHAQELRGAKVVHVPAAGNSIPLENIADAIDARTKLVSVAHVCYRNGVKQDVAEIVKLAKAKGALVLLDSSQAAGSFPIDAKKLKVDFLVTGVLKYLLSPPGLAFAYVRKGLIPQVEPTSTGWFAQANIFAMDIYGHVPSPSARRFESGTPAVPNVYAALAGMKLLQSVGLERIEAHILEITGALKEGIMRRGFNLVTPVDPKKHGAMIAVRSHKDDLLVKWLEKDNIIVSCRDNNVRISPHIYNNEKDVAHVLDCLTEHKGLLV